MKIKKKMVAPVIEVVRFNEKDVITASNDTYSARGVYNINNIKDFFNVGVK